MGDLTELQAGAFREEGFTRTPFRAFSGEKAALYLRQLEEYERAVGQVKGDLRFQTHLILPWVAEVSGHARSLRRCRLTE